MALIKRCLEQVELRKIKDTIGTVLTVLVIVFLLGLIFIPLHQFFSYAKFLFALFLITVPIYLIIEIYYFVKDIPKRKEGTLPKKKKKKIVKIAEWTLFGGLLIVLLLARNGSILNKECPEVIQGNPSAELTIKYFFNSFCPSCWGQEAIVQDAINQYGDNIRLERYDHRHCMKEGNELGVRMVPGFVFQINDETERFGSLSYQEISEIICKKTECEK